MKSLKTILALVLFVLIAANFIFSEELKVRVTVAKANIRLRPTTQSNIVSAVPLGAVLEVIKKEGNWYFVKLPSDEKGIVVTGYIHQSIVEVFEEIKQPVDPKEKVVEKEKKTITTEEKESPVKIESKFIALEPKVLALRKETKDLNYQEWKMQYDEAESDFFKWEKYRKIGMYTTFGVGLGLPLLVIFTKEFSLMGTASALVGIGGAGLWGYAYSKRATAANKIAILEEQGKTKGWIETSFDPKTKTYAVSFTLSF